MVNKVNATTNERIFRRKRNALVEELRDKGIKDESVLKAIGAIPRHQFVDSALWHRAYEDSALPIEMGQTISQPFTVASQTELMQVKRGDKVLEIGTGSGYQCAVLCEMGAKVYTVERHRELTERSRKILNDLGYRAMFKCGDGSMGWSAYAPYDAIVVTAGAPVIPETLRNQLTVGGRLIVPVGDEERQLMMRIKRTGEEEFEQEQFAHFKFVPLIGKQGWGH